MNETDIKGSHHSTLSWHLPYNTKENQKNCRQNSWSSSQDSIPGPHKYTA